ncbi:MAG TPA: hypothetical protein VIY51_27205 [Xanthobacteraceae bacterium]
MPLRQCIHPLSAVLRRTACAVVLAGALITASGAGAEIFKKEGWLHGVAITRAQCDATAQTLWLNVYGRDYCVRYYLSTAGGEGLRPVVFLQGDQKLKLNLKTWDWFDTSDAKDDDTDDLVRIADGFSKLAKTTAIFLARLGLDGTSGNHTSRKTLLELQLMNAALDALKQRHGFEGFHLAGQSGGTKLVGGLIGLRRDVACAVLGSGPLAPPNGPKTADPGRTFFDPNQGIAKVVQDRSLRPILVTDKADKRVPVGEQTGYADRLRKAGRSVLQLFVEATDDEHHGAMSYTQLVAGGCVLGKSDQEIARAVDTMVKRNAEYNQRRRAEVNAKTDILAATRASTPAASVVSGGK